MRVSNRCFSLLSFDRLLLLGWLAAGFPAAALSNPPAILVFHPSHADPADPLGREEARLSDTTKKTRSYVTVAAGIDWFNHNGKFNTPEGEFSDMNGFSPSASAVYTLLDEVSGFGFLLRARYSDASGEFVMPQFIESSVMVDGKVVTGEFLVDRTATVHLQYLSVTPGVRWDIPQSPVFLSLGIEFVLPLSARYSGATVYREPYDIVQKAGLSQPVIDFEEKDIPGGDALQYGADIGAGVDVDRFKPLIISPQVGLSRRFSPISDSDPTWRLLTVYAMVGFTFEF